MASPTQWTWVWVDSGSWWWTGRPSVLWFMGSKRVGHDWETKLNGCRKEMATHSSILARFPWTEEPGVLQFMGLQRVGHDWVTNTLTFHLHYFLVVWPFQSLVPWLLSVTITLDMSYSGDWNVLWRMIICLHTCNKNIYFRNGKKKDNKWRALGKLWPT